VQSWPLPIVHPRTLCCSGLLPSSAATGTWEGSEYPRARWTTGPENRSQQRAATRDAAIFAFSGKGASSRKDQQIAIAVRSRVAAGGGAEPIGPRRLVDIYKAAHDFSATHRQAPERSRACSYPRPSPVHFGLPRGRGRRDDPVMGTSRHESGKGAHASPAGRVVRVLRWALGQEAITSLNL
jgi:hypothetical protein